MTLVKTLLFTLFSIAITSSAFAFIETPVYYYVSNPTENYQRIQRDDGSDVFETALVNNPNVPVNDSNWVNSSSPLLHGELLLSPIDRGMHIEYRSIGRVSYAWWSEGYLYTTRVKFKIKSTGPGKRDRICDVQLFADSNLNYWTILNRKMTITGMEYTNIKNQGICQVMLTKDPEQGKYDIVNIKIESDMNSHEELNPN